MDTTPRHEVLARTTGHHGELVLRVADDGHHEVISNGMFLMDTRDGRSERGLVTTALAVVDGASRVLIGGLGVGWSLGAAQAADVDRIDVVELEPAVVELVRGSTAARTGVDLEDARTRVHLADVVDVLGEDGPGWDVICLDVDNGPDWTLGEGNARLYDDDGLRLATGRLRPGGALAVWGARPVPAFTDRLRSHLDDVTVHTWEMPRGAPDVVWVGRRRG